VRAEDRGNCPRNGWLMLPGNRIGQPQGIVPSPWPAPDGSEELGFPARTGRLRLPGLGDFRTGL